MLSSREEQRTSVVIAHRLSTVRGSDLIVVLDRVCFRVRLCDCVVCVRVCSLCVSEVVSE